MNQNDFTLCHHAAPPKSSAADRPPLLLLLHGFGANEDDLFPLAPYLDGRFLVISPRAPVQMGPMSFAWFNLGLSEKGIVIDPAEVEQSRDTLSRFIGEVVERYSADPDRVFLMGFSQGAMIAVTTALYRPGLAAGVVAMSGRVLPEVITRVTDRDALTGFPILLTHGTEDLVLPISHGRESHRILQELPVDLTYREYPIGHEISYDSLQDVADWLKLQLDRSEAPIKN